MVAIQGIDVVLRSLSIRNTQVYRAMSCPHCFIAVLLLCDLDLTCLPETKLFQSPSNFLSNCPINYTPGKKNLEGVLEAASEKLLNQKQVSNFLALMSTCCTNTLAIAIVLNLQVACHDSNLEKCFSPVCTKFFKSL